MAHDEARPFQRRYPAELRERAIRLVFETAAEQGERHGAVTKVAGQLGIGTESLRKWVHQAEIDRGNRGGLTTEERARLKELERENRELRRANEMESARPLACFLGLRLLPDPCDDPCAGTNPADAGDGRSLDTIRRSEAVRHR